MATETTAMQRPTIWATFRESPFAVKAVLAGVFVNKVGGFLSIFLVLYMTTKGYSESRAAVALGVYGAGSMIGVLIGGALADRLGARNATVLSMASAAALTAALLYLPNYSLLLTAVLLVGLVGQIYRPASATLLSALTPDGRQVMIFAMYRFGLNLGAMAAPLIGFGLYQMAGERFTVVFWGEALIAVAYAVLAAFALPPRERERPAAPAGSPVAGTAEASDSYAAVLRDRRYVLYIIAMFFNAAVYMQYLATLPLDVRAEGLPIFWYTLAVSLNGLAVIAFELPMTKLSQNWPYRVNIPIAFLLVGAGVCLYALPLVPAVIIIGTLVWTFGEIIGGPSAFAYPAVAGPAHLKGRYIGAFQFMFGLGSAVGPMIGGALFARYGHDAWLLLAIGSVLAGLFAIAGVRNPASAQAAPDGSGDEAGTEVTPAPPTLVEPRLAEEGSG